MFVLYRTIINNSIHNQPRLTSKDSPRTRPSTPSNTALYSYLPCLPHRAPEVRSRSRLRLLPCDWSSAIHLSSFSAVTAVGVLRFPPLSFDTASSPFTNTRSSTLPSTIDQRPWHPQSPAVVCYYLPLAFPAKSYWPYSLYLSTVTYLLLYPLLLFSISIHCHLGRATLHVSVHFLFPVANPKSSSSLLPNSVGRLLACTSLEPFSLYVDFSMNSHVIIFCLL